MKVYIVQYYDTIEMVFHTRELAEYHLRLEHKELERDIFMHPNKIKEIMSGYSILEKHVIAEIRAGIKVEGVIE